MDKLVVWDKKLNLNQFYEELTTFMKVEMTHHKNKLSKIISSKKDVSVKFPGEYSNLKESWDLNVETHKYQHNLIYKNKKNNDTIKVVLNHPIFLDIHSELKKLYHKLSDASRDIRRIYSEIMQVYLEAMEKMMDVDYNKEDFKSITLAELEDRRGTNKDYNKILNSRDFLMQIKMKNESFKKYKEFYYSIYRDIDYLENLEKQFKNRMTKQIEHLKNIESILNQKSRILYLKLKQTVTNFGDLKAKDEIKESNLVEFDYNGYMLYLDTTTDLLYSKEEIDEETEEYRYIPLGKRYHYTAVPIKSTKEIESIDIELVRNILLKYLFLKKLLGNYLNIDLDKSTVKVGDLVKCVYDGNWYIGILNKKTAKKNQVMILTALVNSDSYVDSFKIIDVEDVKFLVPILNELYYLENKFKNTDYKFNLQRYHTTISQKNLLPHIAIPEDDINLKELQSKLYPSISFQSNNIKIINRIEDDLNKHWEKITNFDNEPLLDSRNYEGFLDVFKKENVGIVEIIKILLDTDKLTLSNIEEIDLSKKIVESLEAIVNTTDKESTIFNEMFGGEGLNQDIIKDLDNVRAENVKDQVTIGETFGYFTEENNFTGGELNMIEEDEYDHDINNEINNEVIVDDNIKHIIIEPKKKK